MSSDFRSRVGQARNVVLIGSFVFFATATLSVRADDPIVWHTGPKLTKALKSSVSFDWSERPLRDGLKVLSRGTSVAIFLDRRLDASAVVTLKVDELPLSDALKEVAAEIEGSVAMLGPVVYIGPRGIAPRVQALAAHRQAEAVKSGGRWQGERKATWLELAEPRDLAQAIVKEVGADLANPEAIPHDVWPAWEGPSLTSAQALTLVLAGFDLTFELQENGVRIVPAPDSLVYDFSYTVVGLATTAARDLKRLLPDVKTAVEGTNRVRVTGTADDHAKVADLLAGKKTNTKTVTTKGEKRYTLKVENQAVGAVVRTIAKELEVEVQAPESILDKPKSVVNLDVKQVTAQELLKKVLDPVGIKFKLTEKTLELNDQ